MAKLGNPSWCPILGSQPWCIRKLHDRCLKGPAMTRYGSWSGPELSSKQLRDTQCHHLYSSSCKQVQWVNETRINTNVSHLASMLPSINLIIQPNSFMDSWCLCPLITGGESFATENYLLQMGHQWIRCFIDVVSTNGIELQQNL